MSLQDHRELIADLERVASYIEKPGSIEGSDHPAFQFVLPWLLEIRDDLLSKLPDYERDATTAGAIGRLLMDDMANLAESTLGQEIFAATHKVHRLEEQNNPEG